MRPHEQRVVQEKQELDDKIKSLGAFLLTELSHGLPSEEQDRMERQFETMKKYSEILGERIASFPPSNSTIIP